MFFSMTSSASYVLKIQKFVYRFSNVRFAENSFEKREIASHSGSSFAV